MKFYAYDEDKVIDGHVVAATVTYREALDNFLPLIKRLDVQRGVLSGRFYARLDSDIVKGCVMPPITVALVHAFLKKPSKGELDAFISGEISNGFVLDGIQRISALSRASSAPEFDDGRTLHVNFIMTSSRDKLLYRMITLNNGQRPMSARHQIEVLSDVFFDFDSVVLKLVSEQGGGRARGSEAFIKADFVKGYMAYLSDSIGIDNQKIIEEKMDELVASKIMESDVTTRRVEFADVVDLVVKMSDVEYLRNWIRVQNNFIGFCAGIKSNIHIVRSTPLDLLTSCLQTLERVIDNINVSKVKLGKVRREVVVNYFNKFGEVSALDELDLLDEVSQWI
jgi:hypothetical protein